MASEELERLMRKYEAEHPECEYIEKSRKVALNRVIEQAWRDAEAEVERLFNERDGLSPDAIRYGYGKKATGK